jgi:hypothetical protein
MERFCILSKKLLFDGQKHYVEVVYIKSRCLTKVVYRFKPDERYMIAATLELLNGVGELPRGVS